MRLDRLVKARLYARAGIAEFWIFVATDGAVEVYREPRADGYASVTPLEPGRHCISVSRGVHHPWR